MTAVQWRLIAVPEATSFLPSFLWRSSETSTALTNAVKMRTEQHW